MIDGTVCDSPTRYVVYPVQLTNLNSSATSVIVQGQYNACASTNDGSAYCWGYNGNGFLANGLNSGNSIIPMVAVMTAAATPLTNVVKVLNWYGRPCALRTDGSIWCWPDPAGSNYYAVQLKDSASNRITGLNPATVGRDCYLDTDDQVWINGATTTSYRSPAPDVIEFRGRGRDGW